MEDKEILRYEYSPSSNCFYPYDMKDEYGDSWPKDGTGVTEKEFLECMRGKDGYEYGPGPEGKPVWVKHEITSEAIKEFNKAKVNRLIDEANRITQPLYEEKDIGIISDSDLARYKAWAIYRQSLRKVDLSVDEPEWPTKPE